VNVTSVGLRSRIGPSPRLLTDEQIREAHRKYMSGRGLRSVAEDYRISHVQLAAGFHRLGLEVRGNRTTDPLVAAEIQALRVAGKTWGEIARIVGMSLRQVQYIHRNATRES
jgi:hypothetical protein